MNDATILDLGLDPHYVPAAPRGRFALSRLGAKIGVVVAAGLLALSVGLLAPHAAARFAADNPPPVRIAFDQMREVSAMSVDDKAQILVEGLAAQQQNAEIPVSTLPVEAVRGFSFGTVSQGTYAAALTCLTQAVYFEAANEPLQGRRAVAQVVLNRMRHPAYPKSVCGVVYQGSERRTGCQFSFTCDGALLRQPLANRWREAQDVAIAALAGKVEPSVGTATHYHADYVLPKWAFNLGKIEQLGRHIFYRFNGSWGRSSALTGRYSGIEQIPQIDFAALAMRASATIATAPAAQFVPGLSVPPEVSDRHAPADVAGRIDVTKPWRLTIPDPVAASSRYRQALGDTEPNAGHSAGIAVAEAAALPGDTQTAALR